MTLRDVDSADASESWTRWAVAAAVLLAAIVLVLMRWHAFGLPLEADEGNYAYIGQRLLAGDRLYVDVWDHQPPGVFMLFAGVIAVFGSEPVVFRWVAVVFSLATLGFVVAILHRRGGPGPAVGGAVLFALVSSDPATSGEGCNREIYMTTLIVAAWWCVLRKGGSGPGSVVAAGLLLGVASALKTIVALHWLALGAWLVVRELRNASRGGGLWRATRTVLLFGAGPAVVWLAAFAYFGATGRYDDFVDAVFRVNLSYSASEDSFFVRFGRFFRPPGHEFPVYSALPLWLGGVAGIVVLAAATIARRSGTAACILALLVASFVAICLPGQFWPHYYYLLIPGLVMAVSMAVWLLARWLSAGAGGRRVVRIATAAGLYVFVCGVVLATEWSYYLHRPPFGITVRKYNSRDFWARGIAEKVKQVTGPDDRIFVLGNDASIYYYSQRRCASRYTMLTGLRSGYRGSDERRRRLVADLEAAPPRLVLILVDEEPIDEVIPFLHRHYDQPVGVDLHDKSRQPIMLVLADRDRPIQQIDWDWDRKEVGGW